MQLRVFGLENEYALVYHPSGAEEARPSCKRIYEHLESLLRARCAALPAAALSRGLYFANGARLYFEQGDLDGEGGFAELNTPECASARELCVYHFALDEMLQGVLPDLRARIASDGFAGRVSLLKGNVDRDGHTYGASESYLVDDFAPRALRPLQAIGQSLFHALWVLGIVLWFVPLVLMVGALALHLALGVVLLPVAFVAALAMGDAGFRRVMGPWEGMTSALTRLFDPGHGGRWHHAYAAFVFTGITASFGAFARLVYLRRFRQLLVPFLVSRTVLAGNGHIDFARGRRFFRLSSRADHTHHVFGTVLDPTRKPILDIKHYLQQLGDAWRRRKRLVVLYSDAHLCERALYVTAGATSLVLEAIEARAFDDAAEVRLREPIEALHAVAGDDTLLAEIELHNEETLTAIAHQRRYATIVRTYLESLPIVDLAKHQILSAWEKTLDALEDDPDALVGEVDWITKRHLCEAVAGDADALDEVGDWARVLWQMERARLDDADFDLEPDAFWRRLAERMHPHDRREVDEALSKGGLDRARLPSMARLAYALRKVDFKYHDLDPAEGYAALLRGEGALGPVSTDGERARAHGSPPRETRAHARGEMIAKIVASGHRGRAAWDRVVDDDTKEKFALPDPLSPEPARRKGDANRHD